MAGDIELLHQLEAAGTLTPTSLSLADEGLTYEKWEALCVMLGHHRSRTSWWIGDLLNFGEGVYGERYSQAMEHFGLDYSTLVQTAYVCRNVARRRRRATLSFGHHRVVAPLDPDDQEKYLKLALEGRWTRQELSDAVHAIDAGDGGSAAPAASGDKLTVKEAARRVWHSAQKDGDSYVVPLEPMEVLRAKLGE